MEILSAYWVLSLRYRRALRRSLVCNKQYGRSLVTISRFELFASPRSAFAVYRTKSTSAYTALTYQVVEKKVVERLILSRWFFGPLFKYIVEEAFVRRHLRTDYRILGRIRHDQMRHFDIGKHFCHIHHRIRVHLRDNRCRSSPPLLPLANPSISSPL